MTSVVPEIFQKTCRTCMSTDGEMIPIFSNGLYVKQLPNKIMAFTKVEISEYDGLPKVICKKCTFLADSFYCFKEQCESADDRLKSMLRNISIPTYARQKEVWTPKSGERVGRKPGHARRSGRANSAKKRSWKNLNAHLLDNQEEYAVEYLSEQVKREVLKALKRRQDMERRANIAKVSQTIRNLKGIEVVPITGPAPCKVVQNSDEQQQEIVVFPVKGPRRRNDAIETITIVDDSPVPKKRREEHPEDAATSTAEQLDDHAVPTSHESPADLDLFRVGSTVNVDRDKPDIEAKRETNSENLVFGSANDARKIERSLPEDGATTIRNAVQRCDNPRTNYAVRVTLEEGEILKILEGPNTPEDSKPESYDAPGFQGNRSKNEESGTDDPVSTCKEEEDKFFFHPDMAKRDVEILAQEFNEIENQKLEELMTTELVGATTVGRIISEADDGIADTDVEDCENGLMDSSDTTRDSQTVTMYGTDKSNEVFIESEVADVADARDLFVDERDDSDNKDDTLAEFKSSDGTVGGGKFAVWSSTSEATGRGRAPHVKSDAANEIAKLESNPRRDSIEGSDHRGAEIESARNRVTSEGERLKFYQCTICAMNFVSMQAVVKHNIQTHMTDEKPFHCLICDKAFQEKPLLLTHVDDHDPAKPYECTFCPKTFTLKRNLKRHVNHHIHYRPFHCAVCSKRFSDQDSLDGHAWLHSANSPFTCTICDISFHNKANWRRHVANIHEKSNAVVCGHCNKEMPDKRALQVHTRIHTGEKPYECPHCKKLFSQQCNLNTHIHCHLDNRAFVCPHCGKGFNQRGTRDHHLLTHTGEKPYQCAECRMTFAHASALKRHMWTHSNKNRPYSCTRCKIQFVGFYDLRRHLKIKHGEIVEPENPRVERVVSNEVAKRETDTVESYGETVTRDTKSSGMVETAAPVESWDGNEENEGHEKVNDGSLVEISTKEETPETEYGNTVLSDPVDANFDDVIAKEEVQAYDSGVMGLESFPSTENDDQTTSDSTPR